MAKFKFSNVSAQEEAAEEAEATRQPVQVKGVGTSGTPRLEPEETEPVPPKAAKVKKEVSGTTVTLETLNVQLENIFQKVKALELLITAQWPRAEHPKTTNGGHPIAPNGTVAPFLEVPSKDQLLKRAQKFIEAKGKGAFKKLLEKHGVKQLAEITKDQDQAAIMEEMQ